MITIHKVFRTAAALPLVEDQYREHRIEIGRTRLRRALAGLVRGRGVVLLARSGKSAAGVAVLRAAAPPPAPSPGWRRA